MAIIQLSDDKPLAERLLCVICGKRIEFTEATAGLLNADNQQQFACNGHFWSPHQLIAGWADFMATERAKRTHNQFLADYGGASDARLIY